MPRKKRDRFTVEYSGKVELCGSYEKAIARFEELTKDKPCCNHVIVRCNGKLIAERVPLVLDGVIVDF